MKYLFFFLKKTFKIKKKDWIYDYVYQFLISPYWTTPIQEFIDQNCIVIEVGTEENVKKKFQAIFI